MSSYLNFSITDRDELKSYILRQLGAPLITVEITDEQLDDCIDDATELFSKYANINQEYLALDLSNYQETSGIVLPNNVLGLFSLNDSSANSIMGNADQVFSVKNALFGSSGTLFGSKPFAWTGYEIALQYLDLVDRMTGKGFDFNYNYNTKFLKLYPDPVETGNNDGTIIVGVNTIREEDHMLGEDWVKKYSLACAKVIVGNTRSKFKNVQLLGGGSVEGDDLKSEGKEEKEKLEENLQNSEAPSFDFFIG